MRVLELFSGIGGLHWAMKQTKIDFEIVAAMEINPAVLETYSLNFPGVKISKRNLVSLTSDEINSLNIDVIMMSPPCQPFCRTGHGQGSLDARSSPLNHILHLLPAIKFSHIFIENVQGFENSDAHEILVKTLKDCDFQWQEFLINPVSLKIPNSRLRYYLIGKHKDIPWTFTPKSDEILHQLPRVPAIQEILDSEQEVWKVRRHQIPNEYGNIPLNHPWCIGDILEPLEDVNQLLLPVSTALKYWKAVDTVKIAETRSCCFTKAYFHYLTGTGSILDFTCQFSQVDMEVDVPNRKLRYFSPREIARLMCYPEEFRFPTHHSLKQCYKALGNSVNVFIVALLLRLILTEE